MNDDIRKEGTSEKFKGTDNFPGIQKIWKNYDIRKRRHIRKFQPHIRNQINAHIRSHMDDHIVVISMPTFAIILTAKYGT